MNTIEQPCPACGRRLELPAGAVGRLGQCPACQAMFTIGQQSAPATDSDVFSATPAAGNSAAGPVSDTGAHPSEADRHQDAPAAAEPWEASPPAAETNPATAAKVTSSTASIYQTPTTETETPNEPGQHPYSAPLPSGVVPNIPYAREPQPAMQPVGQVRAPQVAQASIEEVLSATVAIFGQRWSSLVIAWMIVASVVGFVFFVPFLVVSSLAEAGGDTAAGLISLVWIPTLSVISTYFWVGLVRVTLAAARDSTASPLSELLPPLPLFLRFCGGALLLGLAIGLCSAVILGGAAALGTASGQPFLAALLSVFAAIALSVISLVLQWLLWSWAMVVSDGRGTTLGSIRSAWSITMNNKLASALLILVSVILSA
ncbi:MAG: hypothetical protein MI861_26325, partial [Pirellulales bacterium]|nr:hypothetical protein [Pirellulales bacterium]